MAEQPNPPATILPSTVIVLHPGAYNLRLGFASESSPFIIPHVIARRIYDAKKLPVLTPPAPLAPAEMSVKMAALASIREVIHTLTDGTDAPDEYAEPIYTESTCATPLLGVPSWTDIEANPAYIVGEAALNLAPGVEGTRYKLARPMTSSSLMPTPAYPLAAITNDLQAIWSDSITSKLGVDRKDFANYHICLVVPDFFGKSEIKDFLNILLRDMGFGAVMVVPSAMCATIGSGLSTACVVDVGHCRTTVTCVDEGATVALSRRTAAYGFRDVARLASWLVRQPSYPYYFPPLPYAREETTFHDLIETHATLIPELVHATKTFEFKHYSPPAPPIAPMGLFYPEAFKPLACEIYEKEANNTRENNYNNYYHNYNEAEDLYDDPYLLEGTTAPRITRPEIDHDGLDLVVAASIGNVGDKNELKRKLYGSILLTGGASRLPGLESILEDRLFEKLPGSLEVERVEVVPSGLELKDGVAAGVGYRDPGLRGDCLAWRGGAIIANVETSREMWIKKDEWATQAVAILRDRLMFGPL